MVFLIFVPYSLYSQKVSDHYPVNEVFAPTKYAQTTPAKTVVGMNEIGFFMIDPRLPGEKMVESKSYFYAGNSKTKHQLK